ncbi:hypothetical protein [Vreelandella boliviensis]|uniref:hypothetical protein n=1 Tax=Vreelandella boliviensis TaxID=223527 RepID=UPI001B8BCB10|nr:hypothetical protein [Halomonas boliviensis]MBS3666348.1 hypothetical protein [Halomonas boliviensis]
MKVLNAILVVTLLLVSGVALAERNSGEDNEIVYPESASSQQDSALSFSPSETLVINP